MDWMEGDPTQESSIFWMLSYVKRLTTIAGHPYLQAAKVHPGGQLLKVF